MAKRIDEDKCIACGVCVEECPNEGISEQDGAYVIDAKLCTECAGFFESSRCMEVCPVEAIESDPDHPAESDDALIAQAASLRPDRFPRD